MPGARFPCYARLGEAAQAVQRPCFFADLQAESDMRGTVNFSETLKIALPV